MVIKNGNVILRYVKEMDIENYIRWATIETEWLKWEREVRDMSQFVQYKRDCLVDGWYFWGQMEVETVCGEHIGWVTCYDAYLDGEEVDAVGIVLPSNSQRKKGNGLYALTAYMSHLFQKSHTLYVETRSDNIAMIRLAEKVGFTEAGLDKVAEMDDCVQAIFAITKENFFERFPNLYVEN